jgi:hypothetical protein
MYLSLRSPTLPLSVVDEYAETTLAQQISQLPGIAQVLVYGAQKFAVRVQVDPVAAAARGIALDDIRTVVAKTNSSTPAGTMSGSRQDITLAATGAILHASDYKDVIVAYKNGAPIKLNEIARVVDSVENDKVATWFNDERAIVLAIQKQPDANTVAVVDSVKERLPRYHVRAVHGRPRELCRQPLPVPRRRSRFRKILDLFWRPSALITSTLGLHLALSTQIRSRRRGCHAHAGTGGSNPVPSSGEMVWGRRRGDGTIVAGK